jgi:hypothetical protein
METYKEVLESWEKDSIIDFTEPSREILKIPVLHSKYLHIMFRHEMAAKKCHFNHAKMRKLKWQYYSGKMSQEELNEHGWEPFRYTLKSDINTYIEGDSDLIKIEEKKVYHEEVVEICKNILKELNNRTWQIKEHMTHERFIQGAR